MTSTTSTSPIPEAVRRFEQEKRLAIAGLAADDSMRRRSLDWIEAATPHRYAYHFTWLGRPVIQFPQDLLAMQELIWSSRPEVIVETGIAHGGSLVFFASMLQMLGAGRVIGVDVEIRPHNRAALESHPMRAWYEMIEGSSIDPTTIERVRSSRDAATSDCVGDPPRTMVVLDSNHSHRHVLEELRAYAPMVTPGCWLVVLDTIIEDLPDGFLADGRWDRGDNAKTAVHAFLEEDDRFEIDPTIPAKLQITSAPDGFLRCVR